MAAYAALDSLMNTMEHIQIHPCLSTTFEKKGIESLGETIAFLLDFIESHTCGGVSKEVEDLESRIASAAHTAEDAIESHVADQILAAENGGLLQKLHQSNVSCDLQKVTEDVGKGKKEGRFKDRTPIVASSRLVFAGKTSMVGFEDYLNQLMDRLTRQLSQQQIIPIIGMGGIGKTTLARHAFETLLIQPHFDVCGWATISQSYSVREILLQILKEILSSQEESKELIALNEGQLGEKLHKCLFNRRYLIILDDMWSIDVWDEIKFFFPDNRNGSCIVVTSRLHDMSLHFNSPCLAINILNEDKSWNLFCQESFGKEGCPAELEEVGKKICENCKGLPLCIVVIGGFLRESSKSREYWEGVARDTYSILNSQGDNQFMNVLSLSYNHLPTHLKPCLLYMGVFAEDEEILVSRLIQLWVAEGFLRPNDSQTLEEVANGYLKDLVGRNLILVNRWGSNGKMRTCKTHDLIRELCLTIAEKEKRLRVMKLVGTPRAINVKRRVLTDHVRMTNLNVSYALGSAPLVHSLINFRFLDHQIISRFCLSQQIPKRMHLLWNLQTVRIEGYFTHIIATSQLWEMMQLRHLKVKNLCLPDPSLNDRAYLLSNLQTLCRVIDFRLSEEVCKRIANVKRLGLVYLWQISDANLQNLCQLHKLESLTLEFIFKNWRPMVLNMTFPSSLKKLTLFGGRFYWENLEMIGSLPNLEVLKLRLYAMIGSEWNPVEGEFQRLKFLEISDIGLITWNANDSHFPVLEKLVLGSLRQLDEIPLGIGDIQTLRTIRVHECSMPCALSVVKILEEQDVLGNEDLQVQVEFRISTQIDIFRELVSQAGGFTSKNLHIKRAWYK